MTLIGLFRLMCGVGDQIYDRTPNIKHQTRWTNSTASHGKNLQNKLWLVLLNAKSLSLVLVDIVSTFEKQADRISPTAVSKLPQAISDRQYTLLTVSHHEIPMQTRCLHRNESANRLFSGDVELRQYD
jgi:hypothetical protein